MRDKRAVVVGAGLGGLTAAAYLAKNGLKVDVFDRNNYPGGYACSFVRGQYEFEASLHELSGIGPPENRGGAYRILEGCDVARRVEFLPIDEFYTSQFPDFKVTVPHGWEAAEEAYAGQFPAERKGIHRLLANMRSISDELRLFSDDPGPLDLLTFPVRGSHLIRSMGLTTERALDREISDPKLKALFCDIWGYYGLPPSRLSWLIFAVANGSYIEHGPYHVKGTSQALSNAFVQAIEESGGRVHLREGVVRIKLRGGAAAGVVTDQGREVRADYVVCNANPIHACYDLIGAEHVPGSYLKTLAERRIAMSTFNVYMGLDCGAEELGVEGHELFVSEVYDQDERFRECFSLDRQSSWAITNYNHADPDFSPPGTSVMVLTTIMDYGAWALVPPERYSETKSRMAAELIDAVNEVVPGLKEHIAVAEVSTPITNMRYSSNPKGSIMGFDFGVTDGTVFRLGNRGPLEGLYFANAWVRPGGGFETVMSSGFLAAGEVMKDVKGLKGLAKALPGSA
jgi:prolycopene isomerase